MDYSELTAVLNQAKRDAVKLKSARKNELIKAIAAALLENTAEILKANVIDMESYSRSGAPAIMLDRLMLNKERIERMAEEAIRVSELDDPIGEIISGKTLYNDLRLQKVRVPIGTIGIIYESRPNVTVDAAVLCLKSSNSVLLRGGKEAINTNIALAKIMREEIEKYGENPNIIVLYDDITREGAIAMMKLTDGLDLLIPRGGAGLIKTVVENATVPVIETGVGNCHIYVDESADLAMGAEIVYNAKTSRPSVCNACETLLVHEAIAEKFLPMAKELLDKKSVILLGCEKTAKILGNCVTLASDDDYSNEFLDYILAVKVVSSIDEAIEHIAKFSTGHSEAIVTSSLVNAAKFTLEVDSAAVYVNASTRFTDGAQFGFGAEIGISTQKVHARGPMGLNELTSCKYLIYGNGQIR